MLMLRSMRASARWLGQDKMLMLRSGYAEVKVRAVASESESRSQGYGGKRFSSRLLNELKKEI
jgi:hypothetical protein